MDGETLTFGDFGDVEDELESIVVEGSGKGQYSASPQPAASEPAPPMEQREPAIQKAPPSSWASLLREPAAKPQQSNAAHGQQQEQEEEQEQQPAPPPAPPAPPAADGAPLSQEPCGLKTAPPAVDVMGLLGRNTWETGAMGLEVLQRGLINSGNTCFRNVVLQALIACEPLVQTLLMVKDELAQEDSVWRATLPTWCQLAEFLSVFEAPSVSLSGGGGKKGGGGGGKQPNHHLAWNKKVVSKSDGAVLPDGFLAETFSAFRSYNQGEQEDAHEFLVFYLDKLHEEVVEAKRNLPSATRGEGKGGGLGGQDEGGGGEAEEEGGGGGSGGDGGWAQVCKGGTKAVLNSAGVDKAILGSSIITDLFQGSVRSEVRRGGTSTVSATLDPFHCLQLDIGAAKVSSVEDALGLYFSGEVLDGVKGKGGRSAVHVRASKSTSLQSLPHVLTLHLKQFYFDPNFGARKMGKLVSFPLVLDLHSFGEERSAHCMSAELRASLRAKGQKARYQLKGVVFHHGLNISGGHYTISCRDRLGNWKDCDDQTVTTISEGSVLLPAAGHCHPYLLFYELLGKDS